MRREAYLLIIMVLFSVGTVTAMFITDETVL
jgi:hypothetical protein